MEYEGCLLREIEALRELEPDLAVLPECGEDVDFGAGTTTAWCGVGGTGLTAVGFDETTVRQRRSAVHDERWNLPVDVRSPSASFGLLAVWASFETTRKASLGPTRPAIRSHERFLRRGDVIVAGDFNNHPRWDRPLQAWNHTYLVADLDSLGLDSAYHRSTGRSYGEEDPTFYHRHREESGDHIDWCFVPKHWSVLNVAVGEYDTYCRHPGSLSDHAPLIVDVEPGVAR